MTNVGFLLTVACGRPCRIVVPRGNRALERAVHAMPQMIIANSLADGLVVFMTPGGGWTPAIAAGAVIEDAAEAERWLAAARDDESRNVIVDPNLIEVEIENGAPRPTAIREAIRAFGPTVRTDLTEVGQPGAGRNAAQV